MTVAAAAEALYLRAARVIVIGQAVGIMHGSGSCPETRICAGTGWSSSRRGRWTATRPLHTRPGVGNHGAMFLAVEPLTDLGRWARGSGLEIVLLVTGPSC